MKKRATHSRLGTLGRSGFFLCCFAAALGSSSSACTAHQKDIEDDENGQSYALTLTEPIIELVACADTQDDDSILSKAVDQDGLAVTLSEQLSLHTIPSAPLLSTSVRTKRWEERC